MSDEQKTVRNSQPTKDDKIPGQCMEPGCLSTSDKAVGDQNYKCPVHKKD